MSGTLTPMAGMGSNGGTLGSPSMLTPQMIQALMAHARMGGSLPGPSLATPMQMMGAHGATPTMAPMPNIPAPQQAAQGAVGGLGALAQNPQIMQQLMALFRGGQSGVNPLAAGVPSGMLPAMPASNGMQPGPV